MKSRIISALIIIAIFLVIVIASPIPFVLNVTIALLSAASLYEVLSATKYIEGKALMAISIVFAVIIPFLPEISRIQSFGNINIPNTITLFIFAIFIYTLVMFCTLIWSKQAYSLEHLSFVFLMSTIIPCFFTTIVLLNKNECGIYYIILAILCAWGADTGGYVFGLLFGRKKFIPAVSPKKTFGGVIGAVAAAVSAPIIIGYCVSTITGNVSANYIVLIFCGVLGGICSIIGDLIASMIKRSYGIKDFGSLIPGHGGIMDRFDSVLFASPMIYCIVSVIPAFTVIKG